MGFKLFTTLAALHAFPAIHFNAITPRSWTNGTSLKEPATAGGPAAERRTVTHRPSYNALARDACYVISFCSSFLTSSLRPPSGPEDVVDGGSCAGEKRVHRRMLSGPVVVP